MEASKVIRILFVSGIAVILGILIVTNIHLSNVEKRNIEEIKNDIKIKKQDMEIPNSDT